MIKLKKLFKENQELQKLSPEVKKHFLEIVSTYNKYQEMMDRKSDLAEIAETLGGITEAARTLALQEAGDWFDAQTIKRNMSELDRLGKQFDKVASEAKSLDQRLNGLYEDMGHILSRYYKLGEISEEQMKQRLGIEQPKKVQSTPTPQQTQVQTKNTTENINEKKLNLFLERNCPTDPGKWAASKSAAKSKFDVYPSAYANGWAAKNYKSKGGGWRKCKD
jgi:hypothetical protein